MTTQSRKAEDDDRESDSELRKLVYKLAQTSGDSSSNNQRARKSSEGSNEPKITPEEQTHQAASSNTVLSLNDSAGNSSAANDGNDIDSENSLMSFGNPEWMDSDAAHRDNKKLEREIAENKTYNDVLIYVSKQQNKNIKENKKKISQLKKDQERLEKELGRLTSAREKNREMKQQSQILSEYTNELDSRRDKNDKFLNEQRKEIERLEEQNQQLEARIKQRKSRMPDQSQESTKSGGVNKIFHNLKDGFSRVFRKRTDNDHDNSSGSGSLSPAADFVLNGSDEDVAKGPVKIEQDSGVFDEPNEQDNLDLRETLSQYPADNNNNNGALINLIPN